jgi:hypothetical protein
MAATKTTTVVDYPVDEFKSLLKEKIFEGKEVKVEFVIQEVGADPMDRFPGHNEVTRVRVSFDGTPSA